MYRLPSIMFLCVLLFLLPQFFQAAGTKGASGAYDLADDRAAVEKVVRDSIGWALNKDKQLLLDSVAHDADFFIFHPDSQSTIVGFEAFRKMVETVFMNEKFKATDFKVKDLRISLSKSGDVAWYSAYLDDHGEWDGRKTGWDDARWTGVVEKREGRWVIVQMHFSIASDKVK